MAKPASKELWAEARRLFECGKSLSDINAETGIDRASISKRAKKEDWEKAKFQPLIADSARVRVELSTLDVETRECVESLIDEKTKDIIYFNRTKKRLASIGMAMIEKKLDKNGVPTDDLSVVELCGVSRVVKDSREGIVGKPPDVAVQVNNSFESVLSKVRRDGR